MKIKAIIVDDEKEAGEALELLLKHTCPYVEIAGICRSAIDAARLFKQIKPDILFLDIEMSGGTGFDLLDIIDTNAGIIFVTAFDQYAIKAIRHGAKDYLLKPVDPDELKAAVDKVISSPTRFVEISRGSTIVVSSNRETFILNKEDLLYLKANGRYTELFFANGDHYTMCKNIGEYESELKNERFFRIHRSYLVNCRHVTKIDSSNNGFAVMCNGLEIELSKRRKTEFLKFLE